MSGIIHLPYDMNFLYRLNKTYCYFACLNVKYDIDDERWEKWQMSKKSHVTNTY